MNRGNPKKLTPFQRLEQELRAANDVEAPRKTKKSAEGIRISPERVRKAGLTEASLPGSGPTDDDLGPETLIHEDGALSPTEEGGDVPADQTYRVVTGKEVGLGTGLDEAELARVKPLDGKPWDET